MVGVEPLGLGEFEDDVVQRVARPLRRIEGQADAGPRLVDGIGHEIDGQMRSIAREAERGREFNGLHAASLIEGVAVPVVDGGQDRGRPLPVDAADQGLVGEGRARHHIDDRLERHGEREFEPGPTATALTSGRHR